MLCDAESDWSRENGMNFLILNVCFMGLFLERECVFKITVGEWFLGNLKGVKKMEVIRWWFDFLVRVRDDVELFVWRIKDRVYDGGFSGLFLFVCFVIRVIVFV